MFVGAGGGGHHSNRYPLPDLVHRNKNGHMGIPPTASLRGPHSLSENSQICHIFILLHSVAPSALGAAARLGV